MKLNGIKKIGFLAAVMLVAFSAFAVAVCPPGATAITQAVIDAQGAAPWVLNPNTTYCITEDIVLGNVVTSATALVLSNNTRLVGAHPGVRVTGDVLVANVIVQFNGTGGLAEDFTIHHNGAAAALRSTHAVRFQAGANDSVLRNVTMVDDITAPVAEFTTAFVEILGGLNITVEGSTVRNGATQALGSPGVLINGGNGHHITGNRFEVLAAGEPLFTAINSAVGNGHDILRNMVVNQVPTTAAQIIATTTNTAVNDNTISLIVGTGAAQAIGIQIANAMIDCVNNTIVNTGGIGVGGGFMGIFVTPAGTNALLEGNRVTGCGTRAGNMLGDAIRVGAANVVVQNNPTLQSGVLTPALDNACGIHVTQTASSVLLLNNPNINSASSGILVRAPNTEVRGNTITDACTGAGVTAMAGGALAEASGITVEAPGSSRAPIADNTILNVSQHGAAIAGGQVFSYAGGDGINLGAGSSNIYVSNNDIRNAANNGIEVENAGSVGNEIIGNTVDHATNHGFSIDVAASNQLLQGNTFTHNLENGVYVGGGALNVTVVDNLLEDNGASGSPTLAPEIAESLVVANGANSAEIRGNTIRSNVKLNENRGIRTEGVRNVVVEDNTIVNPDGGSGTLTHGIVIETGTIDGEFTGNTVQGMIENGILIRGGSATLGIVAVAQNVIADSTLGILFDGGASEVEDNCIYNCCTGFRVTAGVPVNNHTFTNNCICIQSGGKNGRNESATGTFMAENNWWYDTSASMFVGAIDYQPYLAQCPHAYCPDCGPAPGPSGPSHTYGAAFGWYMVSVPLNSGTPSALFGTIAYCWNCATGVYDLVSMIEPEFGYWVTLPASKSVTDSGSQVTTDVTINISCTGWHQVSAPWSYPKSQIRVIQGATTKTWADAVTAGWVRDTIYTYAATTGAYTMPSTMNPWYGYWVRANVSGLSLKLLYASGTPVSASFAPMGPKALVVPADLPPMPPSPSVGADDLEFGNYPNPIVDVHTTTFAVKGAAAYLVEAIKVQIFDLAGRLVYEAEEAGTSLDWHTDSDYGEYLANGVYLYKLYALVDGEWVVSEVKKLAILR